MRIRRRRPDSRRGTILVLVVVCLIIFLVGAAFSVDVAYMHLVQTQVRGATDLAARAGGQALARGETADEARQEIREIAAANLVAGAPLLLDDEDIVFGFASRPGNSGRYNFEPGGAPVNAVRVFGRRTQNSASGPVGLFFGQILGTNTFSPERSAASVIEDRDMAVVVDRSGSMNWPVADGDSTPRINALHAAIDVFLNVLNQTPGQEQISLASYSNNTTYETDLSTNYTAFDQARLALVPGGRTNIGGGLLEGLDTLDSSFARSHARPVLIVLTDGMHNIGTDPEQAARDAKELMPKLIIHTITFSHEADIARMGRVADIGDGTHFHADSALDLVQVFRDVAYTAPAQLIE